MAQENRKVAWLLTYGASDASISYSKVVDNSGMEVEECYTTKDGLVKYTLLKLESGVRKTGINVFLRMIGLVVQDIRGFSRGVDENAGGCILVKHPAFKTLVKHKEEGNSSFESWTKLDVPRRGGLLALTEKALTDKNASIMGEMRILQQTVQALSAKMQGSPAPSENADVKMLVELNKQVVACTVEVKELKTENQALKEEIAFLKEAPGARTVSWFDERCTNKFGLPMNWKGKKLTNGEYLKLAVSAVEKRIGTGLAKLGGDGSAIDLDTTIKLLPDKAEMMTRKACVSKGPVVVAADEEVDEVSRGQPPAVRVVDEVLRGLPPAVRVVEDDGPYVPWVTRMFGLPG